MGVSTYQSCGTWRSDTFVKGLNMTQANLPLRGTVAIVTGAGKGIGRAIAEEYAKAGAAVCCAARNGAEVREVVRAIEEAGGQGLAVVTDVSQADSVRAMVAQTVEKFGRLDMLVINAGVNGDMLPVETSDADSWRQTLDINLVGAYLCAQAAIPALKASGAGKIITVGSGLGHEGRPGLSAYACSKAGLWMLTRVLAQELAPFNINVNELIPGPVATDMTSKQGVASHLSSPGIATEWFKTPADVLPLAMFLATQPPLGPTAQSFALMRRSL
ncbi:MAG TPA: SDR family oxidoreductase [Ramlibacter sp.]|nr:SDR family oxidoreductase [Ramlibacter sp.]